MIKEIIAAAGRNGFGLLLLLTGLLQPLAAADVQRLSMAAAVAVALRSHPEVAGAQLDIEAAGARVMQVSPLAVPELVLTLDAMPGIFKPGGADERSVGLRQSFEFPLKTKLRRDLARSELHVAGMRLRNLSAILAVRVKKGYVKVLFDQAQIVNLERVAALFKQFADLAAARYAAQSGTFLDVLRSRLELARRNSDLIDWRSALVRDTSNLHRLLAIPGSTALVLTDGFREPPYRQTLDEELAARLPDNARLSRGRARIERQLAEEHLAREGFWPDLSLALSFQRLNGQPPYDRNGFAGTRSNAWAVELGFSLPFLSTQGRRGEILQSRAELQKARIELQAAEREVALAIENAWQELKTSEAQVAVFKESLLPDSVDQLRAAMDLYSLGKLDSWQLLDALRGEMDTTSEYNRALYRFNLAMAELEGAGESENTGEEHEE
jgi:cobalt-zinc-cadmium efflux system outer membrane protein